jgi:hypothetical protein
MVTFQAILRLAYSRVVTIEEIRSLRNAATPTQVMSENLTYVAERVHNELYGDVMRELGRIARQCPDFDTRMRLKDLLEKMVLQSSDELSDKIPEDIEQRLDAMEKGKRL